MHLFFLLLTVDIVQLAASGFCLMNYNLELQTELTLPPQDSYKFPRGTLSQEQKKMHYQRNHTSERKVTKKSYTMSI